MLRPQVDAFQDAGQGPAPRQGTGTQQLRHRGPRRRERHYPGERNAHPLGGGRGRFSGRHPPGHDAAGGDGAAAGRVPGHGEPRAQDPADLHQGLRRHADGDGVRPGPRRDAPVLPHHRRAGRLHARPDRRPARRGAHRDGRAVGGPSAFGDGDPGGRGQEQVPERRGQEQPPHRPLPGVAVGHGGRAAHHPGAEQPPHQRGPVLPRGVRHRGVRRAGGLPRGCHRHGRGQRGSPPSGCRTYFGSSPASTARTGDGTSRGRGWASPSARG